MDNKEIMINITGSISSISAFEAFSIIHISLNLNPSLRLNYPFLIDIEVF